MSDDQTTDILKKAILMEKRGQAFYANVARQASDNAVREFFETMANEEGKHIQILSDQFKAYQANQKFNSNDLSEEGESEIATTLLTQNLKDKIAAANYEAAAISAAISMEQNAIALYSERAEASDDTNEKALYGWLAEWEKQHYNFLLEIDRQLTEEVWFDQQFWPF
jgi:rubrerythrin